MHRDPERAGGQLLRERVVLGGLGLIPQLLPTASSSTISVTPAPTTLSYTGTASVTNGQPATLSGVVTQTSSGNDVSGQTVTFTLGSDNSLQSCTATTIPAERRVAPSPR